MQVNYSVSFKALEAYVDSYNNKQGSIKSKIRGGIIHTAKELIKVYGVSFIKAHHITPVKSKEELPSIRTNNVQLGKRTKMSPRSIQRHITRLQQAGIITKKIWHGSNSSFELWINPKILWIKGLKSVNKTKMGVYEDKNQSTENQFFKNDTRTNCPHTDSYYLTNKINNTIIAVDKSTTQKAVPISGNIFQDTHKMEKYLKNNTQEGKYWRGQTGGENFERTAKAVSNFSPKPESMGNQNPTRHASLMSYAEKLWKLARQKLYGNRQLTTSQHQKALELLYRWYAPVSDKALGQVHQVYCKRIEMVEKYLAKDSKRYVQLPFRYFDPENSSGFAGTKKWYDSQKVNQAAFKRQMLLHDQIQKFEANEAKDTAVARDRLTVFRECEQRLGKLDQQLLQDFYQVVANQTFTHQTIYC